MTLTALSERLSATYRRVPSGLTPPRPALSQASVQVAVTWLVAVLITDTLPESWLVT